MKRITILFLIFAVLSLINFAQDRTSSFDENKMRERVKTLSADDFEDRGAKYYHRVTDEYHDWWDALAMVQESELALAIGVKLAKVTTVPRYKGTDKFSAADKSDLGGS